MKIPEGIEYVSSISAFVPLKQAFYDRVIFTLVNSSMENRVCVYVHKTSNDCAKDISKNKKKDDER